MSLADKEPQAMTLAVEAAAALPRIPHILNTARQALSPPMTIELGLLLFAFLLLGALTGASIWLSLRTAHDREAAARVEKIENTLTDIHLGLRASESGQRGYLLTNNPDFLDVYRGTVGEILPKLDAIGREFKDTPNEAAFELMRSTVQEKISEMASSIKLSDSGRRAEAIASIKAGSGRRLMESIRQSINELRLDLRKQLDETQSSTKQLDRILFYFNIAGAILIVFSASTSTFLLWRSNNTMKIVQKELRETNQNLENIVADRTQHVRQANEEIQRFAYIVSHDLRSPLVNIMGFTTELETLSKEIFAQDADGSGEAAQSKPNSKRVALRSEFEEALSFIKSSIAKMDRLIGAVLKISREGSRPFMPEPLPMTELIKSISAAMAHQANEASATITINPLPQIESDRLAVEQIFSNLLDNAIKFLKPGTPGEITVSGRLNGRNAEFVIKDNGRGIDEKDKGRIFELFRRAGPQDRPGEGMGLAHTLTLVRRLGGSIQVESQLEQGSAFQVVLPISWPYENARMSA